jgi:aspartate racemase
VELKLASIWRRVLQIESVGVQDDFFELGGQSLMAGRLFAEIQKSFDNNLHPTTLLRAPTIELLAAFLRGEQEPPRWTSLVPIQPKGSRPPLFCMHAGAGTVLFYYHLARELGPDQPVYALQAQGLYGGHPPHKRVDEMAAHYLREIRAVQPNGPYRLAGFCFGAILAFEMAQQLRQQGEEVALLASFDGGRPRYELDLAALEAAPREPDQRALRSFARRISRHWRNFYRRGPAYLVERIRERTIERARTLEYNLGRRLAEGGRPLPAILRQRFFQRNSWYAEENYRPRPYDGKMVVFSSSEFASEPALGWKELVRGGVEVHPIAGDHRKHRDLMKGKFVREVAARLRASLAYSDRVSAG